MWLKKVLLTAFAAFSVNWPTAIHAREYKLTGKSHFHVRQGEEFTITGYYKYCHAPSCTSCIRQVYLNVFGKSQCLASFGSQGLDCAEHHFSKKTTAPDSAAKYDIRMDEVLAFKCNNNRRSTAGLLLGTVTVHEKIPIIRQEVAANSKDKLFQNDSVIFTVLLSHDALSMDNGYNVSLIWILPSYAVLANHEPSTRVTNTSPGEFNFHIDQILLGTSRKINITVQLDPDGALSVGLHFLAIPTYILYQQGMPSDNGTKLFVGSVETVTINFTVCEDLPRGFLVRPLTGEVYLCKAKPSQETSACFVSKDGRLWTEIDRRVSMIAGMTLSDKRKTIYGMTSHDRCHVFSLDGLIWSCTTRDEWLNAVSSADYVQAVIVPNSLRYDSPQQEYIASNSDGTVIYAGSAQGLHKMDNGSWHLVASWSCA